MAKSKTNPRIAKQDSSTRALHISCMILTVWCMVAAELLRLPKICLRTSVQKAYIINYSLSIGETRVFYVCKIQIWTHEVIHDAPSDLSKLCFYVSWPCRRCITLPPPTSLRRACQAGWWPTCAELQQRYVLKSCRKIQPYNEVTCHSKSLFHLFFHSTPPLACHIWFIFSLFLGVLVLCLFFGEKWVFLHACVSA